MFGKEAPLDQHALAARLDAIEAVQAVGNLKAHYCWLLDARRPAEAGALFTEDGVWDGGELFGRHEGREAVSRFFVEVQRDGLPFSLHGVLTPFIELRSPTEAFGRWHLNMPCTFRAAGGDRAVWGGGWYEDDFVRGADGVWRAREMRLTSHYWTPLDRGWVAERFVGA